MNLPRLPGANARPLFCAYANFFAKPACYIITPWKANDDR